jgi:hypothetical protein
VILAPTDASSVADVNTWVVGRMEFFRIYQGPEELSQESPRCGVQHNLAG